MTHGFAVEFEGMFDNHLARFVQIEMEWITHHFWRARQYPQSRPAQSCHKLWFLLSGRAEVITDYGTHVIEPGMTFLVTKWQYRRLVTTTETTQILAVGFQSTLFHQLDLFETLEVPVAWRLSENDWRRSVLWFEQLLEESRQCSEDLRHTTLVGYGLLYAIIGLSLRHLTLEGQLTAPRQELPPWLLGALENIRSEPAQSVTQWSHAVGFSPAQFRRLFHKYVGVSPQEYLKRLRVEEAQRLLTYTDLSINAIAAQIGYVSLSHFAAVFREATGFSPAQYRKLPMQSSGQRL